ncbi:MAG: two-component system response regulator [Anaerolineaceae bacterium]|nr:two-component system response regulator [Anaerolineaceae bacterium]
MAKVLYIDDNNDNRMLVQRVLLASDYEFEFLEADNAHAGIEMATSSVPDIILMDISMPDMDGLTATAKIRDLPQLSHVPIVALTANAMQGDKERTLDAGCDGYIRKPVDVDKLPDEIMYYIGSRR